VVIAILMAPNIGKLTKKISVTRTCQPASWVPQSKISPNLVGLCAVTLRNLVKLLKDMRILEAIGRSNLYKD